MMMTRMSLLLFHTLCEFLKTFKNQSSQLINAPRILQTFQVIFSRLLFLLSLSLSLSLVFRSFCCRLFVVVLLLLKLKLVHHALFIVLLFHVTGKKK